MPLELLALRLSSGNLPDRRKNALANMPDGARCGVQVLYSRSGHVFIAEKHGNDIVFYDPQPSGLSEQTDAKENPNGIKKDMALVCRLDNLKFNAKLKECCNPR